MRLDLGMRPPQLENLTNKNPEELSRLIEKIAIDIADLRRLIDYRDDTLVVRTSGLFSWKVNLYPSKRISKITLKLRAIRAILDITETEMLRCKKELYRRKEE